MYDPQAAAGMVTQGVGQIGQDVGNYVQGQQKLPPVVQALMQKALSGEMHPGHAGVLAAQHLAGGGLPQMSTSGMAGTPTPSPEGIVANAIQQGPQGLTGYVQGVGAQQVQEGGHPQGQGPGQGLGLTYRDLGTLQQTLPFLKQANQVDPLVKLLIEEYGKNSRSAAGNETRKDIAASGNDTRKELAGNALEEKKAEFATVMDQKQKALDQHFKETLLRLKNAEQIATSKNATTRDIVAAQLQMKEILANQNNLVRDVTSLPSLYGDPAAKQFAQDTMSRLQTLEPARQRVEALLQTRINQAIPNPTQTSTSTKTSKPAVTPEQLNALFKR